MYNALFISPMIPSFNMPETAYFFKEVLNFSTEMETAEYCIYKKSNLTVHLLPAGQEIGQMEFYMEIDDIDGFWSAVKDKVKDLKVREPFNQSYGMREVHIGIPHTNTLLFIGQYIDP